jgi:hypothetical protein
MMSNLSASQERNARALEISGRIVSDLIGELRLGMFDTRVDERTRAERRTQGATEIGDLTKKLASQIVEFI